MWPRRPARRRRQGELRALVYLEHLLQLDDQLPVRLRHLVAEILLEEVDGLAGQLGHQLILQAAKFEGAAGQHGNYKSC